MNGVRMTHGPRGGRGTHELGLRHLGRLQHGEQALHPGRCDEAKPWLRISQLRRAGSQAGAARARTRPRRASPADSPPKTAGDACRLHAEQGVWPEETCGL
jgi:hypothetical protein